MNMQQIKGLISGGAGQDAIETAWLDVVVTSPAPQEAGELMESLVQSDKAELARTLASTLLDEQKQSVPAAAALEMAKALLLALPDSPDIRKTTVELLGKVYGGRENFKAVLAASGLAGNQSPKRALRTIEVCLALGPEAYVVNKFDHKAMKVLSFDGADGIFNLADTAGNLVAMEPRPLADEYEPVGQNDFRVLSQHRPKELVEMLFEKPAEVLIGLCQTHGGKIDANALKERLVPEYIEGEKWSGWWGRARTAAKRCPNLVLEGKNPIVVVYHAGGLTLEDEMSAAVHEARTPLSKLAVLEQYVRQLRDRKLTMNQGFVGQIMSGLAGQASGFAANRPSDALAAGLAIAKAQGLGCPAPSAAFPKPADVLAGTAMPAEAVAQIDEPSLWPAALEALAARPDAAEQFTRLMYLAPAEHLDAVTGWLAGAGRQREINQAAAGSLADPLKHTELCVWLWKTPAVKVESAPSRVQLLARLLNAIQEIEHDWQIKPPVRKAFLQRLRHALAAGDYAGYRQAISEMDEHVAATIKRLVERCEEGLAESVHDDMVKALRQAFPQLFYARTKLPPWLDASAIWTSRAALDRRHAELKDLVEIKMPANAKAIGDAAAHGDLSENSEWKFALEERDLLRARVAKMQDELARARVFHPDDVPADSVAIGSRVTLKRRGDGSQLVMTFLGPWESDVEKRIYSYQTQLAQELMGKAVGDAVSMKIDGVEAVYEIAAVGPGVEI
ncbi:MAG: GreA/GreB family elongation factor [Planctomycetes bacterium]|nr:GreA/GreB family elongation factor [Planctomycetota bacterium]